MKYDRDGTPIKNTQPEINEEMSHVEQVPQSASQSVSDEMSQPDEALSNTMEALDQETPQESDQPKQFGAPSPKNTAYKNNFTILREKAEQAERRALQAEQLLQQYNTRPNQISESDDEDLSFSVDEDSLVEGKHLTKVDKKIQRLENQLKQYQQQATLNTAEAKLKSQYPDFDHVVSSENLANLKAAYPEIAHTINSSNDLYSKAVSAYTMIKKLGISEPVDEYKADKEVARKNAAKPRPMASISPQQGESPLTKANAFATGELSPELKAQLWKETNQYRR